MVPVLYSEIELAPYILWGKLNIEHGGVDLVVAHEPHEGRQSDAGPNHIGSESVPETMWVGV